MLPRMTAALTHALAFLMGCLGWTLAEYLLHRFAGHGQFARTPRWFLKPSAPFAGFHFEHSHHHREPMYFAATWTKAAATGVLVPLFGSIVGVFTGWAIGLAFGLGFGLTFLTYELTHRRIHTHAPTNRYFEWMRLNHLHHHAQARTNHGVTTSLWDRVFGTHVPVAKVRLHPRVAPHWLLDDAGRIRPEFAGQYELVGGGTRADAA